MFVVDSELSEGQAGCRRDKGPPRLSLAKNTESGETEEEDSRMEKQQEVGQNCHQNRPRERSVVAFPQKVASRQLLPTR